MAPLPLFKVGALVLRTLAKPLATRMMAEAKSHPAVAKVCVTFGEFMHQVTSRVYILASGYRVVGVNPLPVEEALNSGVTIASEIIVFCVAGSLLAYEYNASEESNARKSAAAAKATQEAQQQLDDRFEALDTKILVLADRVQGLEKAIAAQEARHTKGGVPLGWIFGEGNNNKSGTTILGISIGGNKDISSMSVGLGLGNGKFVRFPRVLEDDDVIEDDADIVVSKNSSSSTGSDSDSANETSVGVMAVPGGSSSKGEGGNKGGRTWYDWLTWK